MVTEFVSWRHTGWKPKSSLSSDQPAGLKSVELWATKGTDKKYFLILSIQIGFGAHPVSYSMTVRGCRNYVVFVDLIYIKNIHSRRKVIKLLKEGRNNEKRRTKFLFYCILHLSCKYRPQTSHVKTIRTYQLWKCEALISSCWWGSPVALGFTSR